MTADTPKPFSLADNPAILAVLRAESAKTLPAKAAEFGGYFGLSGEALLSQYNNILAAERLAAARVEFGGTLDKYSAPKSLLSLVAKAHEMGLGPVCFALVGEGDDAKVVATLAQSGAKASGGRQTAQSFTFRGKTYQPADVTAALKTVAKSDPLHCAAELALAASGAGNPHKVMAANGWVLKKTGKAPSEKTNWNAYQALKYMGTYADPKRAEACKALRREFRWNFA